MLERYRAANQLIANDEGWRPADAEDVGEHGVALDQRIQGGLLHVAREARVIEADGTGDREDMVEVERAVVLSASINAQ